MSNLLNKTGRFLKNGAAIVEAVPVPILGAEAAALMGATGSAFDTAGHLAELDVRGAAHETVSGAVTAGSRATVEAFIPGASQVDAAAAALRGKTLSREVGEFVADKMIGQGVDVGTSPDIMPDRPATGGKRQIS